MIDPHVHLRDWEQRSKETLYHGLRTAVQAGITGVFDMPNTAPPLITSEMIATRLFDAASAQKKVEAETGKKIFYGLYGGLTADEIQIREMVKAVFRTLNRKYGDSFPATKEEIIFSIISGRVYRSAGCSL